ncbi:hypothetical protein PoB_005006900 [Plakobranchus ocellatus]|uniref:Uncharacterized protein n=1 Tax=Plakobranchus ocellatus TaxID=259542 RepID=A0AAV4BYU2_9GAST|nr:hypothetical protein PoB_005006900 [Plakobranchus ocellatus]
MLRSRVICPLTAFGISRLLQPSGITSNAGFKPMMKGSYRFVCVILNLGRDREKGAITEGRTAGPREIMENAGYEICKDNHEKERRGRIKRPRYPISAGEHRSADRTHWRGQDWDSNKSPLTRWLSSANVLVSSNRVWLFVGNSKPRKAVKWELGKTQSPGEDDWSKYNTTRIKIRVGGRVTAVPGIAGTTVGHLAHTSHLTPHHTPHHTTRLTAPHKGSRCSPV